jgi:hypothetical protein
MGTVYQQDGLTLAARLVFKASKVQHDVLPSPTPAATLVSRPALHCVADEGIVRSRSDAAVAQTHHS